MRDGAARLLIFASLAVAAPAQSPPLEVRARTILASNCEACHGQARMSDFDVRALESILQGGKRGPAVVPGKSAESLLYRAIQQTGELKMPPGKASLAPSDVETIRQWISRQRPRVRVPSSPPFLPQELFRFTETNEGAKGCSLVRLLHLFR